MPATGMLVEIGETGYGDLPDPLLSVRVDPRPSPAGDPQAPSYRPALSRDERSGEAALLSGATHSLVIMVALTGPRAKARRVPRRRAV